MTLRPCPDVASSTLSRVDTRNVQDCWQMCTARLRVVTAEARESLAAAIQACNAAVESCWLPCILELFRQTAAFVEGGEVSTTFQCAQLIPWGEMPPRMVRADQDGLCSAWQPHGSDWLDTGSVAGMLGQVIACHPSTTPVVYPADIGVVQR